MIDRESIVDRLDKLEQYVGYLKANRKITLVRLKEDYMLQGAICRYFQLAVECVTDIAELLISALRLPKPKDAHEAIEILATKNILPKEFTKKFAPVTGFRNILVHDYLEIDLAKVLKHLRKDLEDFDFYVKCVTRYIKKNKQNRNANG